jgi:hypothetical protein
MRVALGSQKGLYAVIAALSLAFVAAMVISTTAAQAQQTNKRGYCHGTGNGKYARGTSQRERIRDCCLTV